MSIKQLLSLIVAIISLQYARAYPDKSHYNTYPPIPEAKLGDFPFSVRVRALTADYKVYRECIGVILSENWVLTEARCNGVNFELTFGAVNFDSEGIHRVDRQTSNWTTHPHFNEDYSTVRDYNFGLLHFSDSVKLNEFVQPIALPFASKNDTFIGTEVTLVTAYFDKSNILF